LSSKAGDGLSRDASWRETIPHRSGLELPLALFLFFLCLEASFALFAFAPRDSFSRKLKGWLREWFTRLRSRWRHISFLSLSLLGSASFALFLQTTSYSFTRKLKLGNSRCLGGLDRRFRRSGLRVISARILRLGLECIVGAVVFLVTKHERS
jgi:hypothetical protein